MNTRAPALLLLAAIAALSGCTNRPPAGFSALFNGHDLSGWQGLIEPPARATLAPDALATTQAAADQRMHDHWHVINGNLVFDGGGDNLCTFESFGDFELFVDWKITKGGDSGIYIRGSPQVQIWDNPIGSGGLYNNQKHPHDPLAVANRPVGQWNTFHIKMIGENVTVWLNGKLVVDNTPLENYWDRTKPIYPAGPIELQNHGSTLYFRNVFVKRLDQTR